MRASKWLPWCLAAAGAILALLPVLPDNAASVRATSADSLLTEVKGRLTWRTTTYVYRVPVHWLTETGTWQQAQLSIESKLPYHRATVRAVFATVGGICGFALGRMVLRRSRNAMQP